jgi:pyrimidine-nucleoside phosphorylase
MVHLAKKADSIDEARAMLVEAIESGRALETFKVFVEGQDGDSSVIDQPDLLPQANMTKDIIAQTSGYVQEIVADEIGIAAGMLGAGRMTKESEIDLAVGLVLNKKVGDYVEKGDVLVTLHTNTDETAEVEEKVKRAYRLYDEKPEARVLIYDVITE